MDERHAEIYTVKAGIIVRHAEIYTVKAGIIVRRRGFSDRAEALEAVGLRE